MAEYFFLLISGMFLVFRHPSVCSAFAKVLFIFPLLLNSFLAGFRLWMSPHSSSFPTTIPYLVRYWHITTFGDANHIQSFQWLTQPTGSDANSSAWHTGPSLPDAWPTFCQHDSLAPILFKLWLQQVSWHSLNARSSPEGLCPDSIFVPSTFSTSVPDVKSGWSITSPRKLSFSLAYNTVLLECLCFTFQWFMCLSPRGKRSALKIEDDVH